MTATTDRPNTEANPEPVRISWMESLGFSQSTSVWSDRPPPGRHEAPVPPTPTVADWSPTEVGTALTRRKIRWGLIVSLLVVAGAMTYGGYWFYQQPAAQSEAAVANMAAEATTLASVLPALEVANEALVSGPVDSESLIAADQAARSLFEASSELQDDPSSRSAAADAASMTLDAVRLINDGNAYRAAVTPVLLAPALETDPELIELDEAARSFGEWQLQFDAVRVALPDGVLSDVTVQLDVLSANMTGTLENYVDALREDDPIGAQSALDDLQADLDQIREAMAAELTELQTRASSRITDANTSLDLLVS